MSRIPLRGAQVITMTPHRAMPPLGGLAGAGLLLLLAGAAVVHLRKGDPVAKLAPAAVCAVLVASYLTALFA